LTGPAIEEVLHNDAAAARLLHDALDVLQRRAPRYLGQRFGHRQINAFPARRFHEPLRHFHLRRGDAL
jgi:hypothetical protein